MPEMQEWKLRLSPHLAAADFHNAKVLLNGQYYDVSFCIRHASACADTSLRSLLASTPSPLGFLCYWTGSCYCSVAAVVLARFKFQCSYMQGVTTTKCKQMLEGMTARKQS